MENIQNRHKISVSVYFILTVLLVGGVAFECMLQEDNTVDGSSTIAPMLILLAFAVACPWLFMLRFHSDVSSRRHRRMILMLSVAMLWAILITLLIPAYPMNINGKIIKCVDFFFPILVFSAGYMRTQKQALSWIDDIAFLLVFGLLLVQYYRIYNSADSNGLNIGVSYYLLVMLPLLLLNPHKIIRMMAVIVVAVVLFSSGKRGGMMAFVGALFVYFLLSSAKKGGTLKRIFVLILTSLGLACLFVWIYRYFDSDLLLRFSTMQEDGGSGRLEIWSEIVCFLGKENVGDLLVGNGYLSTLNMNGFGYSAHNDFLEIVSDFGVFGLGFYLICISLLCVITLRMIKEGSEYAAPMASAMIIFLVLSMLSIVVLYSSFTLFFLTFGVMLGNQSRLNHVETSPTTIT